MKLLSLIVLVFINSKVYAQGSTAGSMNTTAVMEGVNAGMNGSFASDRMARCSSRRFHNCVMAAAGYAQVAMSLLQMLQTMGSRDSLSPGTDWANPTLPTTIGPIAPQDRPFMDPILTAVATGRTEDFLRARDQLTQRMQPDLERLKNMGINVNPTTGALTDANGNPINPTGSLADVDRINAYGDRAANALGLGSSQSTASGSSSGTSETDSSRFLASNSGVDGFLNKLDKGELDANKVSGLSKNTKDGEAIGVSMGNLFKTVHVKYKALSTQNHFK